MPHMHRRKLFPLFDEQGDLRPRIMAQSHATHASDVDGHVEGPAFLIDSGANRGIADMESSINHCMYYANLHRMVPIEQLET